MEKDLILITGSVMNSDSESVKTYKELILLIDKERYNVSSPLETMQFTGTDDEKYVRAMQILSEASLMIAEMSNVSTGQGMEIQQAANLDIPILVIAKNGSKVSGLVKGCHAVKGILFYGEVKDISDKITGFVMDQINKKHSNNM